MPSRIKSRSFCFTLHTLVNIYGTFSTRGKFLLKLLRCRKTERACWRNAVDKNEILSLLPLSLRCGGRTAAQGKKRMKFTAIKSCSGARRIYYSLYAEICVQIIHAFVCVFWKYTDSHHADTTAHSKKSEFYILHTLREPLVTAWVHNHGHSWEEAFITIRVWMALGAQIFLFYTIFIICNKLCLGATEICIHKLSIFFHTTIERVSMLSTPLMNFKMIILAHEHTHFFWNLVTLWRYTFKFCVISRTMVRQIYHFAIII